MLIMSSSIFFKYLWILLFLLLAVKIESQMLRFPSPEKNDRSSGSPDCNCIPIRRCRSLRNRRDWRSVGETCGYGSSLSRRVCCPTSVTHLDNTDSISVDNVPPLVDSDAIPVDTVLPLAATVPPVVDAVNPPNPPDLTEVCGLSNYEEDPFKPLIMGGENATEGQWPWMTAIGIRESTGDYVPWCSGFLIDNRHVISAAHCFGIRDDDRYRARIGSINQNAADEYRIIRIAIPDGYTSGRYYDDIAILTLDREVNFPNFNPVCLPDDKVSKIDLTGKGLTIAGWGTDRNGGEQKIFLQYLSHLPVVSNQECQRTLRRTLRDSFQRQFPRGINRGFICAAFKEAGKSACGGDSGGPQMIQSGNRWYAVGIVSFGIRCGIRGMPAGFTRVSNYLEWIKENTRD